MAGTTRWNDEWISGGSTVRVSTETVECPDEDQVAEAFARHEQAVALKMESSPPDE